MARTRLSRERILRAALELADEGGVEALSMRKLAHALDVEAMSLYNHVANKRDVVDGIVDLVVEEIDLPSDAADWEAAVRRCAISAHDAFVRHPWACGLAMSPSAGRTMETPRMRYMEWLLRRLREAGFSAALAYHAYHAIDSHIHGFTLWQLGHVAGAREIAGGKSLADLAGTLVPELRARGYAYLAEHAEQHFAAGDDGAREFEFGLDLILDGLKRARIAVREYP